MLYFLFNKHVHSHSKRKQQYLHDLHFYESREYIIHCCFFISPIQRDVIAESDFLQGRCTVIIRYENILCFFYRFQSIHLTFVSMTNDWGNMRMYWFDLPNEFWGINVVQCRLLAIHLKNWRCLHLFFKYYLPCSYAIVIWLLLHRNVSIISSFIFDIQLFKKSYIQLSPEVLCCAECFFNIELVQFQ